MTARGSLRGGGLLLCAGLALGARGAYLNAKAALAGLLLERAWHATQATGRVIRPWPWADLHPIARLRIPSLGLDQIVLDDANPRSARVRSGPRGRDGVARRLRQRRAGRPPHLLVRAAARDRARARWCGSSGAAPMVGPRGACYRVEEIRIVSPEDASMLAASTQATR